MLKETERTKEHLYKEQQIEGEGRGESKHIM